MSCALSQCLQVCTDLPLKQMTADNKAAAQLAIHKVKIGGGTNLSGGLFKGVDQQQQVLPSQETVSEQSNTATGQFPVSSCMCDLIVQVLVAATHLQTPTSMHDTFVCLRRGFRTAGQI